MSTTVTRRRVTADWAGVFGGFAVRRPMMLLRRVGPVAQGSPST